MRGSEREFLMVPFITDRFGVQLEIFSDLTLIKIFSTISRERSRIIYNNQIYINNLQLYITPVTRQLPTWKLS